MHDRVRVHEQVTQNHIELHDAAKTGASVCRLPPRHASELVRTPNRSCYTCIAHLAQVLVATSFRPAASSAYFTVAGPCTLDGACVRSPNYPSDYGNSQSCTITPTSLAVGQLLSATAFSTRNYDKLIVNGVTYSGLIGPSNVLLGSAFTWSSDHSFTRRGWEVCAQAGPPPMPSSPPLPSPPPPPLPPSPLLLSLRASRVARIT